MSWENDKKIMREETKTISRLTVLRRLSLPFQDLQDTSNSQEKSLESEGRVETSISINGLNANGAESERCL